MFLPLAYGLVFEGEEHYGVLDNDGYFRGIEDPLSLPKKEIAVFREGLAFLLPCEAEILGLDGKPVAILGVGIIEDHIACTSIEALEGRELTGQLLRQIPIANLVKEVARSQVVHLRDGFVVRFIAGVQGELLPGTRKRRTLDENFLKKVADTYRQAVVSGLSTQDEIQRKFGPISDAGARRWVMQARKAGFLGEALGPWRAGEASPHSHPVEYANS